MFTIVALAYAVSRWRRSAQLGPRKRGGKPLYRLCRPDVSAPEYQRAIYAPRPTLAQLSSLQMTRHNQTVFYLERMQPDWLPQRQRWVPIQGAMLTAGLGSELLFGLPGALFPGGSPALLLAGLGAGLVGYSQEDYKY